MAITGYKIEENIRNLPTSSSIQLFRVPYWDAKTIFIALFNCLYELNHGDTLISFSLYCKIAMLKGWSASIHIEVLKFLAVLRHFCRLRAVSHFSNCTFLSGGLAHIFLDGSGSAEDVLNFRFWCVICEIFSKDF